MEGIVERDSRELSKCDRRGGTHEAYSITKDRRGSTASERKKRKRLEVRVLDDMTTKLPQSESDE